MGGHLFLLPAVPELSPSEEGFVFCTNHLRRSMPVIGSMVAFDALHCSTASENERDPAGSTSGEEKRSITLHCVAAGV